MSATQREDSSPRVSVIIPVYNGEDVIGEQLEALAGQDVDFDWEILVCDNGSTDGTRAVVETWRDRLPPVQILDASHRRGPSAAMNTGARASRAEFLLFCDADDVVGERWVEKFAAALSEAPYVGAYVEYERLKAPGGMSVTWEGDKPFIFTLPVLPHLAATGSGNFGIHRTLYLEVDGFEEGLETCEDADFSWRVQLHTGEPLTMCDALYHVRTRQTLRSIAKQSRAWGSSYPTLYHRWALVNAQLERLNARGDAGDSGDDAHGEASDSTRSLGTRIKSALGRIGRGEFRSLLSNATWRINHARGRRTGTIDHSIAQVQPPKEVREIVARLAADPWRLAPTTAPSAADGPVGGRADR